MSSNLDLLSAVSSRFPEAGPRLGLQTPALRDFKDLRPSGEDYHCVFREGINFKYLKFPVCILFSITGSNLKEFMKRYCPQDIPEMKAYSYRNIFIALHKVFCKSGKFLKGMPERVGVPFDFVRVWGLCLKYKYD